MRVLRERGVAAAFHSEPGPALAASAGTPPRSVIVEGDVEEVLTAIPTIRELAGDARVIAVTDAPQQARERLGDREHDRTDVASVRADLRSVLALLGDPPATADTRGRSPSRPAPHAPGRSTAANPWNRDAARLVDSLTPREHEVLRELVTGRARPQIAERLGISPHTVRSHLQSIFAKLNAHSRLEAVATALRAGLRPAGVDLVAGPDA